MNQHFEIDERPRPRPQRAFEENPLKRVPSKRAPVGDDGKPKRKRRKKRKPSRPALYRRVGAAIGSRMRAGRDRIAAATARSREQVDALLRFRRNIGVPDAAPAFTKLRRQLKTGVAICIGTRLDNDTTTLQAMRQQFVLGVALCFLVVFGLGGWAATAELAGAIIAPGTVSVESEIKTIQHPTGGIVGEINVRDGQLVTAGEVLMRLDETTTRANLGIVTRQLDELTGRRVRLETERDNAGTVVFPEAFLQKAREDPVVERIVSGERALFEARRAARAGQAAQLSEQIAQLRQEIEGLEAQKAAKSEQSALTDNELRATQELHSKSLSPLSRLLEVQRNAARLRGEHGQIIASIAEAKGKIAETELQIIQLDQTQQTEVLKELREIEGRIGELTERKISGEDQLKRVEVRAPQGGYVHQLAVHTVGGVVSAGDTLMLIVPRADDLTVDAKTEPQDIDQVALGQPAVIRLSAFNQRTTPELHGKVTRVAADVSRDEAKGTVHYMVRVAFQPGQLARLDGLKLVPGMPAEVHIQTGDRTALSYFLKPLSDQFNRAFRED